MDNATITGIIIAAFGTIIIFFWSFSQSALGRERAILEKSRLEEKLAMERVRVEDRDAMKETLTRIQNSIDRQTASHKELSDAINKVSNMFDKLNLTLQMVEKESIGRFQEIDKRIEHHHAEIEMLRTSRHRMLGYITAIRLQAQLKGWEFKGKEWDLPGVPVDREDLIP